MNFYVSVILAMKAEYDDLVILQSVESDKEILDKEWKEQFIEDIKEQLKQRKQVIIERLTVCVDC